ncbi:hypothetical protein ACFLSP_05145 [Bacteroidota bacterium]
MEKSGIKIASDYYTGEKTSDVFREVVFQYKDYLWDGVLPKFLEKQGLDLTDEEFIDSIRRNYDFLNPVNRDKWIENSDTLWADHESATYKVLKALYSGEWECRVCGPVPQVNPQPAARLRDIKKRGYVIASMRKFCKSCNASAMHDILVMIPIIDERFISGNELRAPMSEDFKKRVKGILNYREISFNVRRSGIELLIDHKFPSQRWSEPEIPNGDLMTDQQIRNKFQLLNNQMNMLKSRYCDRCVKENVRGDFMGIKWYYQGDEIWRGNSKDDEKGCIGCPWYDIDLWRNKLQETLAKLNSISI